MDERRARLAHAIEHAAHFLPSQAPLEVFVHHNTLHAFEHLPFHEAVDAASRKLHTNAYLPEERYRVAFASGRIAPADLDAALASLPPAGAVAAAGFPPAVELARLVLVHGVGRTTPAHLRWLTSEKHVLDRFSDDTGPLARERIVAETLEGHSEQVAVRALWAACCELSRGAGAPARQRAPRFLPDRIAAVSHEDADDLVHPLLIAISGAFLDRGQSHWSMPDREEGFYVAWRRVLTAGMAVRPSWLATLGERLRDGVRRGVDAERAILEIFDEIGLADDEMDAFVEDALLRLPGWAGMFHRLESAPGRIGRTRARVRLVDFLAVRLTLDVLAWADIGRRLGYAGPLRGLSAHCAELPAIAPAHDRGDHDTAWPLFRVAQLAGVSAPAMHRAGREGVAAVVGMLDAFDERARQRVWHQAYERHYEDEILHALAANVPHRHPVASPRFQVVTCIDDRAESLRRHFEALSESHETFSVAGFFNLAIAYQGIDDPGTFPLCPVVVEPRHSIHEEPASEHLALAQMRQRLLRQWGRANDAYAHASRSLLWGPIVTAASGFLAALPILATVFAPGLAARLGKSLAKRLLPSPKTRLAPERPEAGPGDAEANEALFDGFTIDEKAARVGALLEEIGLTHGFAPLVAIVGHDASTVNNPQFAAYSCGACGGRSGGPNARLFARMANRPEVRARLRGRGIDIPETTSFVGGVHETCADAITFFDVDALPVERLATLEALRDALDAARRQNAHERCRNFESAPRDPTPDQALRHVEARSMDPSQPRPELGHATNASCIVGRRSITRGLFLDRRAFLASYDPTADPSGAILERVLLAVGPVGAGINLEYFFSSVDNERLGAGTKLPHNVTGLFGVMNGASSDLRTGLPSQMIEVHEPLRLLLVVEATPETLSAIVARQPTIARLVKNEWVRLAAIAPDGSAVWTFDAQRGFLPWAPPGRPIPEVEEAVDWYGGKLGFLPPARLTGLPHRTSKVPRAR